MTHWTMETSGGEKTPDSNGLGASQDPQSPFGSVFLRIQDDAVLNCRPKKMTILHFNDVYNVEPRSKDCLFCENLNIDLDFRVYRTVLTCRSRWVASLAS